METLAKDFFDAYFSTFSHRSIFTYDSPAEMMLTEEDEDGWFDWKLIKGTLDDKDYQQLEKEFNIQLPKSFIDWHKEFFFLGADTSLLRLPVSNPNQPLKDLRGQMSWFIPEQIIPHKLYPFGDEGNDAGPLVFDGRVDVNDNEFPIRFYDHEFGGDLAGLSEVIFSSFEKLIECMTHFMKELKTRKRSDIIPDFFAIDPAGAGSTGIDYWLNWAAMLKGDSEGTGE